MNTITVNSTEKAANANQFTRERRFADTEEGPRATLAIYRGGSSKPGDMRGKIYVSWNVDRGAGWAKGWRAARESEAEALAFADKKWAQLIQWLIDVTPAAERDGAGEAFSAQVATMMRA